MVRNLGPPPQLRHQIRKPVAHGSLDLQTAVTLLVVNCNATLHAATAPDYSSTK